MIQIKFKNFDKSEIINRVIFKKIGALADRFKELHKSKILVSIEMESSPDQVVADHFKIKLRVSQGRYDGVSIEKTNLNFYVALDEISGNLTKILGRFGDRARVRERKKARELAKHLQSNFAT
jgi:ribosome-associated translation inhibitor RaiA